MIDAPFTSNELIPDGTWSVIGLQSPLRTRNTIRFGKFDSSYSNLISRGDKENLKSIDLLYGECGMD